MAPFSFVKPRDLDLWPLYLKASWACHEEVVHQVWSFFFSKVFRF